MSKRLYFEDNKIQMFIIVNKKVGHKIPHAPSSHSNTARDISSTVFKWIFPQKFCIHFLLFRSRLKPTFLTLWRLTTPIVVGRTAPLTSKRFILYIYSTNTGTEYFKHGIYCPFFFPLQNAICFINLTYLVPALFTFYIQGVLKLKKNNSSAKRLILPGKTLVVM